MAEPRGDFSTIKGEKFQMASMLDRALKNFEFQLRHGAVESRHSGAGGTVFRLVLIHNISVKLKHFTLFLAFFNILSTLVISNNV